jgi:peptidoglycan hydrolase-like protein with peptidoglycan-binding domain
VLWRVEWDNPEQSKNSATASFNPPNYVFTSLNQIGQGEENVPTSFTISGGGGVTPPPGTARKLIVTVMENAGDKPIDGATVVVSDKSAKTAGGGKATFELPPGTHKFKATADGFKPSEGVTEMPADKDSELTIFMEKEGSDFTPPPESKQPTLRRGAKSEDKWVEYLQQLLGIPIDGKFGPATEAAVRKFQTDNKLKIDGIVGNQTWAALRGNEPEKPSTDGRPPNTFVEKGPEARWFTENKNIASYDKTKDELRIVCVSLGDAKIDDFEAKVQVSKGGGSTSGFKKPPVISVKIGPSFKELPGGVGFLHAVRIQKFRVAHGSGTHTVEAFLPLDLGGDRWKGDVEVS